MNDVIIRLTKLITVISLIFTEPNDDVIHLPEHWEQIVLSMGNISSVFRRGRHEDEDRLAVVVFMPANAN